MSQFITKAFENIVEVVKKSGNLIVDAIMKPPRYFWGLTALTISAACLGIYLSRKWIEAKPN